jgi:drug/metabolite transporter (DMT)-like permease
MFMIFLSGLLFAFMSALTRVASDAGLPALQVVFLSGVVRWVGLGLTLVGEGESPMATPAVRPVLLFRSFCGWASFSGATYAFGRMPLGDATSIFLTSPIWAAILARLLLKEALSAADCLAILLCFGGVLLVIRPGPLSGGDPASPPPPATPSPHANTTPAATGSGSTLLPSLIVLAGAVFAALVAVTVRLIQQRGGAHPAVIAHAYALFTAIVSLPVCYLVPGQVPSWRGIPNEAWAACLGARRAVRTFLHGGATLNQPPFPTHAYLPFLSPPHVLTAARSPQNCAFSPP